MSCKVEAQHNKGAATCDLDSEAAEEESRDQLSCIGVLPWHRGHSHSQGDANNTTNSTLEDINPGEFVLRALFTEFTVLAERKIDRLLKDAVEKPLSKSLQRGEDPQFDQLLSSLSSVAEHCLSSLLRTLFQWYDRQTGKDVEEANRSRSPNRGWSGPESPRPRLNLKEKDPLWERRDLAVEFIFCLVLIEVLKQLSVHPVEDSQVQYIENLAFRHFKDEETGRGQQSQVNRNIVTALYAEVIGVLAQTRFQSVRKRFMQEYKDNQGNPRVQVNVILGLKFIRIKLYPVDELEESFLFLQELATLFLEKNLDKEVKYAFTSLFVEILIPVASVAKREYNVPAVKKFVDLLFKDSLELAKKAKHIRAMYPLVTALLCISQKQFFLTNWVTFLNMCLSQIKSRDIQMQRMSMECLHRLIWVYVIRIKCENHASTILRLRSVVDTLFPKGSRTVVPRNVPLTIFVKIIQFIGQEKLDFAMQDVIFDLLNIGKGIKQLNPERMNIGLRAFLVIADNLQRKEGAPPMPGGIGALPSRTNNTLKVKKTFTKLTEEAARNIGVVNYYTNVRRALDAMLKTLDAQIGRPMTMMNPQFVNKDVDDMITGERKAKIDLFRTCVAAIPKCIPDGMNKSELVELVSRLTLHKDEELKTLAFTNLQSLIMDFPEYREEVLLGYISFVLREVPDTFPSILENSSRMLLQLLVQWRTAALAPPSETKGDGYLEMSMQSGQNVEQTNTKNSEHVLHCVEGFALIMLCSTNAMLRKLALSILKETRVLLKAIEPTKNIDNMVINTIEDCSSQVIEKALCYVSGSDKSSLGLSPQMDLHLLAEKSALLAEKEQTVAGISRDLWAHCLAGFLDRIYSGCRHCSCIFQFSWPFVYTRLFNMYSLIDPSVDFDSITSRASSISFKAPKKTANLPDICLWRNYLIFVCSTPPKAALSRSTSMSSLQEMLQNEADIKFDLGRQLDTPKLTDVLKTTVLLIRSESHEIREAAVTGLGKMVPIAHAQFVEEMHQLIREVLDKKAEGVRKKRKRDLLRLQVVRVFAANADQGCFRYSLGSNGDSGLSLCISEYIDGMRHILDMDNDKDEPGLVQLRLYFSKFLHKMIKSIPLVVQGEILRNQSRHNLFFLLASWCGHFNVSNVGTSTRAVAHSAELEFSALEAMCALLCCGEVFDQKALEVANGYIYRLLDTMLISENNKVYSLGHETLELMLDNNKKIPSLLRWVIDRCYTGKKGVSNGCFMAIANVFSKKYGVQGDDCHSRPYPCQLVPLLCVVLFKTGDSSPDVRERAAQLLYLLDRRFFSYMIPFRSAFSSYSYGQQNFSQELAVTHSELTLPMLSEMTLRFETTSMVGQRCLLHFLLPWLGNIELIDVTACTLASKPDKMEVVEAKAVLKPVVLLGMGWGSSEATQMVLNNLFYLTVKYDEYFSKEIEACWAALSLRCEENNHIIFDYLIVMAGLCGTPVLSHAKKVAIYVARANTMKSVDELMEELKLTETVTTQWDRLDCPPYYRPAQKIQSSPLADAPESASEESDQYSPVHVKHNSFDQDNDSKSDTSSVGKRPSSSQRSSGSFGSAKTFAENVLELSKQNQLNQQTEESKKETGTGEIWAWQWTVRAHQVLDAGEQGIPLPMPEDLKYFAPLTLLFPMTIPPAHLYRCNFALVLLTEIVSDRPDVHWIINLPLMLHVAFLGLDHMKPLVHEHCKRLLINLVVTLVCGGERSTVAKALMDFQSVSNLALDRSSGTRGSTVGITEEGVGTDSHEAMPSDATDIQRNSLVVSENAVPNVSMTLEEKARELIEFLAKSDCKPLWAFEDITPRHCSIKSAEQLEVFLRMVLTLFEEAVPHALLLERWGREALHWATSCSSRHYAGRSFQVFRALHVPLSWTMLSDILQRLAESVAETSEDVQGYVLEILFTFLSEVDCANIEYPRHQIEALRQDAGRRPSLDGFSEQSIERSSSPPAKLQRMAANMGTHNRSFSSDFNMGEAGRHRTGSDGSHMMKKPRRYVSEMILSRVSQPQISTIPSLKAYSDFQQLPENPLDMFARLFWIAVSLLESDYEHEFVMAIRLLEKVLDAMDLTRSEALERIEKLLNKLNWPNFPGVQSLLLKGLTSTVTAEPTLHLLSKLTVLTSVTVIDPSPVSGLSLNIIALLPRLIIQFDDPDEFSVEIAQSITKACDKNKSLHNLGKVMTMYKDKEYSKSVQVWIECVCKYILDTFPHLSTTILALLVEILEQGPPLFQQAVLNMICAILKYSDSSSPGLKQFHNYLLKIVTAHVKDVNLWKESLNILKLVVSNASQIQEPAPSNSNGIMSSALVQPRGSIGSLLSLGPNFRWGSNQGLGDSSWSLSSQLFKKELPGRTLEFTYNVAATPLIGAKFNHSTTESSNESRPDSKNEGSDIMSPASGSGMVASNRKPHTSQRRTRERLVSLLPLCGHKGGLKQSLSVIFSSSSDLAVDSKPALSSEETSGDEQPHDKIDDVAFTSRRINNVMKEFDFLDELDNDSEDMTNYWASTELPNDDPYGIGQVPSRSGSEPDLVGAIKDEELTDEEDSESLQLSSSHPLKYEDSREEHDVEKDKGDMSKDSVDVTNEETKDCLKSDTTENAEEQSAVQPLEISAKSEKDELQVEVPEPSPVSVSSADSTLEALDRAQIVTSENVLCAPRYFVLSYEDIPYKWSTFVTSFVASSSTSAAADSLPCFPMVLKACGHWLQRLTRECCDQFESGLEGIHNKFLEVEETLENELKLPYIFVDQELFRMANLLTRHKFAAIKLNEGLQVLQEKREQAQEHLDLIQATKRGSSLDSDEDLGLQLYQTSTRDVLATDTRVMLDLSTCLYRIHMQFVMCLEVYLGYIEKIITTSKKNEVNDFSQDLLDALDEIASRCREADTDANIHPHINFHSPISAEGAIEYMIDLLKKKHFVEALRILQAYRNQSWSDFIGRKDDELDTMVAIYTRFLMSGKSRYIAVSGSIDHLNDVCDKLSEYMADLLSRIYDMADH